MLRSPQGCHSRWRSKALSLFSQSYFFRPYTAEYASFYVVFHTVRFFEGIPEFVERHFPWLGLCLILGTITGLIISSWIEALALKDLLSPHSHLVRRNTPKNARWTSNGMEADHARCFFRRKIWLDYNIRANGFTKWLAAKTIRLKYIRHKMMAFSSTEFSPQTLQTRALPHGLLYYRILSSLTW